MFDRQAVVTTAVRAVTLLLHLGRESYDESMLKQAGSGLCLSPYVGKIVDFSRANVMVTGPDDAPGSFHVIILMSDENDRVEAYCEVQCDDTRIFLVRPTIRVNGRLLSHRNVTVDINGGLGPWYMPDAFDIDATVASIKSPDVVFA